MSKSRNKRKRTKLPYVCHCSYCKHRTYKESRKNKQEKIIKTLKFEYFIIK